MRIFKMLLLLIPVVSISYASSTSAQTKEITLVADQWCPYNCVPGSENPGLLVEIANYSFLQEGYKVNYIVMPWVRSILTVRNGEYDGIIGAGRDETPDFIFPDEPLHSIEHVFFVKNTSDWRFNGLKSLQGVNLGVIKNYSYGSLFTEYIEPNQENTARLTVLHGDDAFSRLVRLVKLDRIDVFVEESNIVTSYLIDLDAYEDIKSAGVASKEDIYIAFSPKKRNAKLYADILSKGFKELKSSGKLDHLLLKYSLLQGLK